MIGYADLFNGMIWAFLIFCGITVGLYWFQGIRDFLKNRKK